MPNSTPKVVVSSSQKNYAILRPLAQTPTVRYYLCSDPEQKLYLLCIASNPADSHVINSISDVLNTLMAYAKDAEEQHYQHNLKFVKGTAITRNLHRYAADCSDGQPHAPSLEDLEEKRKAEEAMLTHRVHYDWLFPSLVESFVCASQGNRQVIILEFPDLDLADVMPLSQVITHRERVDLKTSAWIIGRMLKLQGFIAMSEVSANLSLNRFMIAPHQHRLIMFDWAYAYTIPFPDWEKVGLMLSHIGSCGLQLIGIDHPRDEYPYPIENKEVPYVDFLRQLAFLDAQFFNNIRYSDNFFYAHHQFYDLVHRIWGKSFHPFTSFPK